jgi:hypothetical protein
MRLARDSRVTGSVINVRYFDGYRVELIGE